MNAKPQSKSMLEDILERPSDAEMIAQGLLPESCVFHVETALTYARMAHKEKSNAKTEEFIKVVIEHLQEIKKKLDGAK